MGQQGFNGGHDAGHLDANAATPIDVTGPIDNFDDALLATKRHYWKLVAAMQTYNLAGINRYEPRWRSVFEDARAVAGGVFTYKEMACIWMDSQVHEVMNYLGVAIMVHHEEVPYLNALAEVIEMSKNGQL